MKKWYRRIQPWFMKSLGLPSDIMLELPRITMIGQIHIYIENHQGLEIYSETELKLKSHQGYIRIIGTSFILKKMYPGEILLERSEEHTSELQSRGHLVCRLLLEKKKKKRRTCKS